MGIYLLWENFLIIQFQEKICENEFEFFVESS